ncbi:proto-oncogene c-Fos-like isoform X2 [Coregonus clupeaformis]|uniref:proto-oncogene c-Fos-like isoform X2 n=1 Tax=Coregonus clupeaformis TaxID=59861 RepID=UPI001BE0ACD8|nr:proto-oncogene c-Fos-like isoform X2 [Coregonus clupeaformis]
MFLKPDFDSMSRCSTESPVGDTLTYYQKTQDDSISSFSASPSESNAQELCPDMDIPATPFVPTVTAISTTPDLQWMVQPTIIRSLSPSLGSKQTNEAQSSHQATPKAGESRGKITGRKGKTEKFSPEEEEKKRVRRERNKMAAAKCRNRRRELTDSLQTEPIGSPDLPPSPEGGKLPEDSAQEAPSLQDMDIPNDPSTAISGNSNILLCASVEVNIYDLEPSLDMKEGLLDNLLPSMEEEVPTETARSVPDIDLSGSLGVTDWETLYKSVSNELEPLSTPVVTSTPTCSSYLSVFTFSCPELDHLGVGFDGRKSGGGKAESVDIFNSPTLLAL